MKKKTKQYSLKLFIIRLLNNITVVGAESKKINNNKTWNNFSI